MAGEDVNDENLLVSIFFQVLYELLLQVAYVFLFWIVCELVFVVLPKIQRSVLLESFFN